MSLLSNNLASLQTLATQLEETSKVVKEEIEEQWTKMEQEKEQWEKEKVEMASRFKIEDVVICLNVGGKELATYKSVLCSRPDSVLAAMFSGRHPFMKDKKGRYFIDRNGEVFSYILDYLRSGLLIYPSDDSLKKRMKDDMIFFGLLPPFTPFADSAIVTEESDTEKLEKLFPSLTKTKLLYRASRDGWSSSDFHRKCDGVPGTVSFIQVGNYACGGFTPIPWDVSGSSKFDSASFLFSLRNPTKTHEGIALPNTGPSVSNQHSTYCHSSYSVTFGGGHDIYIASNSNQNTQSYSNLGHSYKHPTAGYGSNEAKNFFVGHYQFTPSEVEVYAIEN
eukprot:TRINITY_DN10421_c0_g1_i1.p1 TRINITY_DN10421_c0_g1~~TRINITY_DN10421_c0_g1_i1.p1  ORF type:complete len:335 (+),score=63.58 TRINITY_DN10421_c0_g1_i1:134-1138(+)